MRRAWLLALVAAPAIAAAQAEGQITFDNGRTFPNYINAAECAGDSTIDLAWTVTILSGFTGFPLGGTYQVYASNQQPTNNTCFIEKNESTGLFAGPVGAQIAGTGQTMAAQPFDPSLIVTAAGKTCTNTGDQTIYVCVQGTSGGSNFGFATGTLTLSVSPPPAPVNVSVAPGDSALNVSWDPGVATSGALGDSQEYQVDATFVRTTSTATDSGTHSSGRVTATDLRLGGLVNTVVYGVTVTAFSKAGNQSSPSDPAKEGMPEVVDDFWDAYSARGREQGGCASGAGAAGTLALLAAASLVALLRRRK
jgi:uncharacterized protein (TIGR03382 family)